MAEDVFVNDAKVMSKGQVTIPKHVREALGVETGDRVYQIQGRPGGTVSFGTNYSRLMNLSLVYGEFDPAKEYRVVLQIWEDPQDKEYYTCPLPLWD